MTKTTKKTTAEKKPEPYKGQPKHIVDACEEAEASMAKLRRRIREYRIANTSQSWNYDGYTGQQIRRGDPGPLRVGLALGNLELEKILMRLDDACQGPKSA